MFADLMLERILEVLQTFRNTTSYAEARGL